MEGGREVNPRIIPRHYMRTLRRYTRKCLYMKFTTLDVMRKLTDAIIICFVSFKIYFWLAYVTSHHVLPILSIDGTLTPYM